jgi:hypothetical protein
MNYLRLDLWPDGQYNETEELPKHWRLFMTTQSIEITEEVARKVIEVVDAGLVKGKGQPIAGKMCVEAAVCFAMGLPHGDDPPCVSRAVRSLKIELNDSNWSSDEARGKGLRRLAVAQLGSSGAIDDTEFVKRVAESVIRKQVPLALRAAASVQKKPEHQQALLAAADRCQQEGTSESANAAAYAAANAAARDEVLSTFAEDVVQILISMNAPGCKCLFLTEETVEGNNE